MKAAYLALLAASVSANRLTNGPAYFNEPTWTERMPSAGGFLIVSACVNSGVAGVTCSPPNSQLFATGMNGDEDLGEDIIMKESHSTTIRRMPPPSLRSRKPQSPTRPRKCPFSRPQSLVDTLPSMPRRTEHLDSIDGPINKELDNEPSDH